MIKELFEIRYVKNGVLTSLHALNVMELNNIKELLKNSGVEDYKVFNRRIEIGE